MMELLIGAVIGLVFVMSIAIGVGIGVMLAYLAYGRNS